MSRWTPVLCCKLLCIYSQGAWEARERKGDDVAMKEDILRLQIPFTSLYFASLCWSMPSYNLVDAQAGAASWTILDPRSCAVYQALGTNGSHWSGLPIQPSIR